MLSIKGLAEIRARLEAVRVEEVLAQTLAAQADAMAAAVRAGLGDTPGTGAHDRPWERTGALQASVGAVADGLEAAVGSSDPAAAPQEMGTLFLPPRPFLAPVAAGMGEGVAEAVGAAVAAALRGAEAIAEFSSQDEGATSAAQGISFVAHSTLDRQLAAFIQRSSRSLMHLVAAGDRRCDGYAGGCTNGGSFGTTAMYRSGGRWLCLSCAVKKFGVENESSVDQLDTLKPYLIE